MNRTKIAVIGGGPAGLAAAIEAKKAGEDSILVLAGMGIRTLSMSPKLISATKELLSHFTIKELESISDKHFGKL